jgi:hypothetical protein
MEHTQLGYTELVEERRPHFGMIILALYWEGPLKDVQNFPDITKSSIKNTMNFFFVRDKKLK